MGCRCLNPEWWQRLRHRRGFGIHSPFAFRFITEVLNPRRGYVYYAEECVRGRNRRFLARLAAFLGGNVPVYYGPRTEALRAAGAPSAAIDDAALLVLDLSAPCPDGIPERIARGDVAVFCLNHGGGRIDPLLRAMPAGMSFRNRRSRAVLMVRDKLPRQDFWVSW
ncbi:MAG: hypothetical protein K2L96_03005 [Muribaculaceae bacterium]|nr:hypothetical protein [Muribaculaceae bacterium]